MDLGIHVVSFKQPDGPDGIRPTLAKVAKAAEDGGCSSLSVMDHFFQLELHGLQATEPMLEGYTTLGYFAGLTSRIQLHLLVTGVTYRYPGVLAKTVTTLDVLSGGRAGLGIGAAWYEREHRGLGVPYPPLGERFELLEEALQIVKQMWSGDDGPFEGQHYQLAETLNIPQVLQRPHPPIMIGGTGERKTLRLVAKYGDACNLFGGSSSDPHPEARTDAAGIQHKLDVLRQHCENEGADYDRIEKTILYIGDSPSAKTAGSFVEEMATFADVGITRVMVMPIGDEPARLVEGLGTYVVPELSKL